MGSTRPIKRVSTFVTWTGACMAYLEEVHDTIAGKTRLDTVPEVVALDHVGDADQAAVGGEVPDAALDN